MDKYTDKDDADWPAISGSGKYGRTKDVLQRLRDLQAIAPPMGGTSKAMFVFIQMECKYYLYNCRLLICIWFF